MIDKLEQTESRFKELEEILQQPDVIRNSQVYTQYRKEHGFLNRIVSLYRELKKVKQNIQDTREMMEKESDSELREMAKEEIQTLGKSEEELLEKIQNTLVIDEEEENKNVIVEIRGGEGGEEACLFVRDIFQMYSKFAERKRWKSEILDSSPTDLGGFKEIIFSLKGKLVYGYMKYESGGHRVQRVPITEGSGRIHTSLCTVAVLPEVEEVDIQINPKDLKIDMLRASGPGGQNVNKTSSAIRITHLPSGIVVRCQDTPEQYKNKMKAMRILRSKLLQKQQEELHQERNEIRIEGGSGERSDKIRTYNFPQNRLTDHRIKFSLHNLLDIIQSGELDEMVEALRKNEREKRLQELSVQDKK